MIRMDDILVEIKKSVPERSRIACRAALVMGMVAHIYMFTNKLPNYDDVYTLDGFGATFRLGRWFLWVLGAAAYHLDLVISLPWINGLVSILLLVVSAGFLAELLGVKSRFGNLLIGASVVVFPTWTSTFFFMFTAPYYAVAVLMMTLAVYLHMRLKHGGIGAVILIACSLGIYQAYLPYVATLYVVVLFLMLFDEGRDWKAILKKAMGCLVGLIFGVASYYLILRLFLVVRGEQLSSYKGVSSFGGLSTDRIPEIIKQIVSNTYGVFTGNRLEISYNLLTKGMYLVLLLCTMLCVALLLVHLLRNRNYGKAVITVLLLIAFETAINGIFIMCAEGTYSLMYYSFVFLMIFPVCLLDRCFELSENKLLMHTEIITAIALLLGVGSYCHYANAQYLSMELCYEQASSYFNTMITQIKSADGYYDGIPVAFIGNEIQDTAMYQNEIMDRFYMSGRDRTLIEAYSRTDFLRYYCGFSPDYVSVDDLNKQEIEAMPVYPDSGSIQVIDGVVVVKLQE